MCGEEAARLFYDEDRFERAGVAPSRVQETLFGRSGVQGMDGAFHRRRKELFLSLMSTDSIARLADSEVGERTRDRAERWIGRLVKDVRAHRLTPEEGSALRAIAWHRDLQGRLLDQRIAAVEFINVVRPTVAIAWYVISAAVALHQYPECQQRLLPAEEGYLDCFVQEVRRLYPFFPVVAARTRQEFEWNGYRFPQPVRVLLDLYGTNHDARLGSGRMRLYPSVFADRTGALSISSRKKGDDHLPGHRCLGEWITIELMKVAAAFLHTGMRYDVPQQDLGISLSRIPALPNSRFVIANVRLTPEK